MPKYVLVAGVNGAGKSTLYHSIKDVLNIPRVNTDEILQSFGDWRDSGDIIKAGKIAVKTIYEYLSQGISFQQETTLCGKSILKNINRAKAQGYEIEVYYIGLETPEIAKKRVAVRVAEGGHGVPEDAIERRYYESMANMKMILGQCGVVSFYDNSKRFRLIATYKDGRIVRESLDLPQWYIKHIK